MIRRQFHFKDVTIAGRVFIHNDAPKEVHEWFKNLSIGIGADKVGGNYKSYVLANDPGWIQEKTNHF